MYSNFRSVQILISLLKQKNISHIVLSPGGSDIPLIHSIETDEFFNCYSVVDERSAAYFAMGIAQNLGEIVACICTSGSAVCNYLPGITEAFYQNVPVLAITADKNPYFQGQLETQKIDQSNIFSGVVKKSVELPLINNSDDEWLCNRLVNEALLELNHHGTGPVHINIPIVGNTDVYDCIKLPVERCIQVEKLHLNTNWEHYAKKILHSKRILIVVGQNIYFNDELIEKMNKFFSKVNCVYSVEHISNLNCEGCIYTYPITEMCTSIVNSSLLPDIVISLGNNLSAYCLKPILRRNYLKIDNWLVSESGEVRDAYKCLTSIFECSVDEFFTQMLLELDKNSVDNISHEYYDAWNKALKSLSMSIDDFSNFYVAQQLSKIIPENAVLHLAILNSTRIMQFFELAKGVKTYSNVGTLGIDGCFSTFAGQAATTNELAFLLIGDLSFFYDMNAAGLRSISNNVRIILLNNGGGSEFHFFMGKEKISTINDYICAEHTKKAEGWIKSLGYDYYSAENKEELDAVIKAFGEPSDKPMFLEILTDMEYEAINIKKMYKSNSPDSSSGLKDVVKAILPHKQVNKLKKIVRIIKE